MKNFRLFAATLFSITLLSASIAQAQPAGHTNWMEKMKSEKIAYLTSALALTPKEAQVFWPIYNQIEKEKRESQIAMMKAYGELAKAINENASEKEVTKLLEAYLSAKQKNKDCDKGEADRYRKVLSNQKVAKLFIAEEQFRRHHIRNMKGGHHGQDARHTQGGKPETGR